MAEKLDYIEGAGDYMCRKRIQFQMGYEVTVLNDNNIANSNLSQYDAIISRRTCIQYQKLRLLLDYNKLMKYVENGGNLIVQYNTSDQVGNALKRR